MATHAPQRAPSLTNCVDAASQVNGKVFYVDADHFGDTDLLALLSPPDPDQPPQRQPSVAKMGGAQQ